MDKDSALIQNQVKLIILICGDSKTGKKTIVKQIKVIEKAQLKNMKNIQVIFLIQMNF